MAPTVSVDATSYAIPLEQLRHSLASTDRFQQLANNDDDGEGATATVAAAKLRIAYYRADENNSDHGWGESLSTIKNRAIIREMDEQEAEQLGHSAFSVSGWVVLVLHMQTPAAYQANFEDEGLNADNWSGQIRDQLIANSRNNGLATFLDILNIKRFSSGKLDPDEMNGQHVWECCFALEYGGAN